MLKTSNRLKNKKYWFLIYFLNSLVSPRGSWETFIPAVTTRMDILWPCAKTCSAGKV